LTYAEIAAKGGGILHSARLLNDTPEDELFRISYERLLKLMRTGTGAIEIKSGYGLTLEGELKMLRVIRKLRTTTGMIIRSTFLGAHAIPETYSGRREEYIHLIIEKMIPAVAKEKLADYIDVFCEKGFFTPEETKKIITAGKEHGMKPKIHANQLHVSGGVETGVELKAVSVDRLESMDESAIKMLAASGTIGTLLPTAAFFLRMPYQPARALIDAGCSVALASDFNPGSSPSGNMNFVASLSCIALKMLPEEVINASTFNGACAMEVQAETGSIAVGKRANIILTRPVPSVPYLFYAFGENIAEKTMINGEWMN
jgi:imidazolonepropionase